MLTSAKQIALIFSIFFSTILSGQSRFTDSVLSLLNSAKHDSSKCRLLSVLVEYEYDENVWPKYNQRLYNIADSNLKRTLALPEKELYIKHLANAINNKGFLAQEHGDISKALEYYFEAVHLQENLKDNVQLATSINNIAYIYMSHGEYNKAEEYVLRALELQRKAKYESGVAASLNNLGNLANRKKLREKALNYFNEALTIYQKINDLNGSAVCLTNIGSYYLAKKDYDKAKQLFNEALVLKEKIEDPDGQSYIYINLANTELEVGNLTAAYNNAQKGYQLAKQINYIENLRNSSQVLYKIYKKQNKKTEALEMYEIYIAYRDSINNEETRKSSIRKELQYKFEKKAAADSARIESEKKVISAQLKQEETKRFALIGGLTLVALFGAFMFNRFRVTQKQNILIQHQKAELQEQKELIEEAQKETLDSIHYAKRIQNALIANADFVSQHLPNSFIYFNPKDIVSGDFYWATHHNNKFYLAICDSTGHGVPGAFMSLLNMGFLSEAIKEKNIEKPNEVFNYARKRLIETISNEGQKDGMDGILLCLDLKNNKIEYAAANNEPIIIRDQQIIELPKDKMPVGKGEKQELFTLFTPEIMHGDTLYLYTDGFADQFGGPKGKKFKYKQLNELLLSNQHATLKEQHVLLENAFHNWKGDLEQVDDVLIAGIKF